MRTDKPTVITEGGDGGREVERIAHQERIPARHRPSMTALVSSVLTDARDLVSREIESAKLEMQEELQRAKKGAINAAVGGSMLLIAGIVLAMALTFALTSWFEIELWVSGLIVGVLILLVGVALLLNAKKKAEKMEAVPKESIQDAKRDVRWLKERVTTH